MRLQVQNYQSPAIEKLENFVDFYEDDKIVEIEVYEVTDGTLTTNTISGALATAEALQTEVIKETPFLLALVDYDPDLDGTNFETYLYLIVDNKGIVTRTPSDAEVLVYLFEQLGLFESPENVDIGTSTGRAVLNANDKAATITVSSANEVSNTLNITFEL